jgi:MOSC domain-containing protein YiiM
MPDERSQPLATVRGLYVTHAAGAPMVAVDAVDAVAQRGLVGDRYFLGTGYYSGKKGWGANVTLIESEAIAAINAGYRTNFTAAMLRRNIVTAHIKLESLIGKEFYCGSAILRGTKTFPPCAHLARLIGQGVIVRYLAYCGGIGAEVIVDGMIRLQDHIAFEQRPLDSPRPTSPP